MTTEASSPCCCGSACCQLTSITGRWFEGTGLSFDVLCSQTQLNGSTGVQIASGPGIVRTGSYQLMSGILFQSGCYGGYQRSGTSAISTLSSASNGLVTVCGFGGITIKTGSFVIERVSTAVGPRWRAIGQWNFNIGTTVNDFVFRVRQFSQQDSQCPIGQVFEFNATAGTPIEFFRKDGATNLLQPYQPTNVVLGGRFEFA